MCYNHIRLLAKVKKTKKIYSSCVEAVKTAYFDIFDIYALRVCYSHLLCYVFTGFMVDKRYGNYAYQIKSSCTTLGHIDANFWRMLFWKTEGRIITWFDLHVLQSCRPEYADFFASII